MLKLRSLITALALAAALSPAAYAASSSKAFAVTNTGNGPLTITEASVSGNPAEFTLTGNTCTSVVAGGSCALTVTFTPNGSGTRTPASLTFSSNGTNGPTHSIALSGTGAPSEITRFISANASDVNMATLFGNPATAGTYVLTINSGVYVTASSTATAALTTGTFPAGSTVKIVNNGYILGKGGGGGNGGRAQGPYGGQPGLAGGAALSIASTLRVDNTNGYIFGGGGGGGGGGSAPLCGDGGGGGGGAGGGPGGAGAAGGAGSCGNPVYPGSAGSTVGGSGGAASFRGGDGGEYGATGMAGVTGSPGGVGGAGGPGGKAIVLNGHSVIWLGGNNAAQVKGAVQ